MYGLFNLDVEIVCRQNNVERECTKIDFEMSEKYKHYLCRTNGGNNSLIFLTQTPDNALLPNILFVLWCYYHKITCFLFDTDLNTLIVTNPCTATAIQNNEMYHPYPYDDTKFIKCDYQQKMYITQCPNGERYHQVSQNLFEVKLKLFN